MIFSTIAYIWSLLTFMNMFVIFIVYALFQIVVGGLFWWYHQGMENFPPRKERIPKMVIVYLEVQCGEKHVGAKMERYADTHKEKFGGWGECVMYCLTADTFSDVLDTQEYRHIIGIVV